MPLAVNPETNLLTQCGMDMFIVLIPVFSSKTGSNKTAITKMPHCALSNRGKSCPHPFPNSSESGGKRSGCRSQLVLCAERAGPKQTGQSRTEASAGPKPEFMQSNEQRRKPIQAPQTSELAGLPFVTLYLLRLLLSYFLLLTSVHLLQFLSG